VDKIQIDVVEAQFLERQFECFQGRLLLFAVGLGGYEELIPGNTRSLDGCSQLLFISVN
jgi:hypothetical protein